MLDGLNSIQLEPIDLSALPSNDETVERAILIPNDAKNVSGEETVSVRITIKGKQIKTLRTTNIVFVGVDEEKFKATSLSQQVQVTIRADAAERGNPMRLRSLTNETRAELEALYPGKFEFTACRNSYDYIYTVEELSELHGKKLQSKRNHCNRFEDEFPDWFTAPITDENLPQCHEMLRIWYEQHEPAVNAQELDQLQLEKAALQRAFDHFDELEMDGLLLSDGERIIAFSMGSRMNRDYYDVGFEKAFPDVNGAYAMINREFSRMIAEKYPEVRFLNREDDMGSEGLRRAKESYQPTVLLEKYTADWKES